MGRSTERTLAAVVAVAALFLAAGCSLIPGMPHAAGPPAPPAPAATATPAVSKSASGTAVPVPGLPKTTRVSSDIDGVELRDVQAKGALVVDLQAAADYKKEHVEGAVNVPLADLTKTSEKWPRDRAVVVYDKTGAGAQAAQSWLERAGFTRIYHLFRGLDGYDDNLAGASPTPVPPREPVLYYFHMDPGAARPSLVGMTIQYEDAMKSADDFIAALRGEFPGEFEYHGYDITTADGLGRFLEFGETKVPMFRLVDEDGHSEQFVGIGTMQTVRAHLKRAIENYRRDTGL